MDWKVFLILVVFVLATFALFTYYHEQVHVQVCEHFGGTATVDYGLVSNTKCDGASSISTIFDLVNELVGYDLLVVLGVVLIVLFLQVEICCELKNAIEASKTK